MIFALADRLGKTAAEIMAQMSYRELAEWVAYLRIRKRQDESA